MKKLFIGVLLLSILLVSHAYSADNLFVDNEDGSVTDLSTGLMWSKNTLGEMAQYVAKTFCSNLELAGYDDWRLPNLDELGTLVDNNFSPTINTTFFPDTLDYYLSSEDGFDVVYGINFINGTIFLDYWSYEFFFRAVRTIQPCDPNGDSDGDTVCDNLDNCPNTPNGNDLGICYSWSDMMPCTTNSECPSGFCSMNQEDTYPPQGNGIGDACDCESNFDCDYDVDAEDVMTFLTDFGRSQYFYPCTDPEPCKGDFICDGDVDAEDIDKFLEDFGRSQFNNPCPPCVAEDWCVYP